MSCLNNILGVFKNIIYFAYFYPRFNYYISKNFRLCFRDFKLKKIPFFLYHIGTRLIIRLNLVSGKNIFDKFSIRIKIRNTNISPIRNIIVFNFQNRFKTLAIGNLAISNQYCRLWVKKNPFHYIVFNVNHTPDIKPSIFELIKMNPDVHEIWCFDHPEITKILNNLPDVIKVINIFKPWYAVESAVLKGIQIPLLVAPNNRLIWANEYINQKINNKKKLIFTCHIREDPSHEIIRNPDFANFIEFIKILLSKYNCIIIRLGTKNLTPIAISGLIDTIGENLSYLEQCALISLSRVFIGCQSGPQITAAAFGIPTFCISYIADNILDQNIYGIKSIKTPKIEENKREIVYKKILQKHRSYNTCVKLNILKENKLIDPTAVELFTLFDAFLKRNQIV